MGPSSHQLLTARSHGSLQIYPHLSTSLNLLLLFLLLLPPPQPQPPPLQQYLYIRDFSVGRNFPAVLVTVPVSVNNRH